jgi:hypothetical protein
MQACQGGMRHCWHPDTNALRAWPAHANAPGGSIRTVCLLLRFLALWERAKVVTAFDGLRPQTPAFC